MTDEKLEKILSLPFLLFGIMAIISPLWDPLGIGPDGGSFWMSIVGMVMFVLGGTRSLRTTGWTLDRSERTLTEWWGLVFPMVTHVRTLDDFDTVRIKKDRRRVNSSRRPSSYFVDLVGPIDDLVEVAEADEHRQAREKAEEIAAFLNLKVRDDVDSDDLADAE